MAAVDDFDDVLKQYHLALDEIMKGSADGYKGPPRRRKPRQRLRAPRAWMGAGC